MLIWTYIKDWFKRNWVWFLFPVGLAGLIGSYFIGRKKPVSHPVDDTLDMAVDGALYQTAKAVREREAAIDALEKKSAEKLSTLSEDQRKEYALVKEMPVSQIAEWIDKL